MSLTLEKLGERNGDLGDIRQAVIEVPEFNLPDAEEDETVNVHSITVGDRALILKAAGGANRLERASMTVIAALTARDDRGHYVFGKTRSQAIRRVELLPEKYGDAIARIAAAALHLTAGYAVDRRGQRVNEDDDEDESVNPFNEARAVERAEKN